MNEQKVPKLRFPEFTGEWGKYKNDIEILSGNTYPLSDYSENGVLLIQGLNISSGYLKIDKPIYISKNSKVKHFNVEQNDILLGLNRPITNNKLKICQFKGEKAYLYQRAGILKFNKINIKSNFLYQYLRSNLFLKKLSIELVGSDQPYIKSDLFQKQKTYIPSLPEQEKIAAFLTLFDKEIELEEKKLELLKENKKGYMQKVFSQEIRFKDDNGNDYPQWEEKKLGEIGNFKTSSVDKKISSNETLVNLVNYTDVYHHREINLETIDSLMKVTAKPKQLDGNNLLKGDILFTPSSETPNDIGHSVVIFEDLPMTLYSYHLMRFRPSIKLSTLYSHYFCNIPQVLKQIEKFATGSTRFTVSVDSFFKIKIQLPCIEEQGKIANFLSTADKEIELMENKIEKLNEIKKGLLQQMFI